MLMLPAILKRMKQGGSRLARLLCWSSGSVRRPGVGTAAGFTITEVMVVLAVTGMLFVSAVVLINGRQSRTQFSTGINLFQQQLQQVINETGSGYFPQYTAFSCTGTASTPPTLTNLGSSGDHQGQNPGCIFLGKVVQFAVQGTDPQAYRILPIVGNRLDATGSEASTLYGIPAAPNSGTHPEAAVAGTTAATNLGLNGAETTAYLTQGLTVVSMWYGTNTANTTGTAGFITSLPSPNGTNGVASGTQHMSLYTVGGTSLNQDTPHVADAIYPSGALVAVSSVNICVASGTTNQSGLITIGPTDSSSAASLTVLLTIKSGTAC